LTPAGPHVILEGQASSARPFTFFEASSRMRKYLPALLAVPFVVALSAVAADPLDPGLKAGTELKDLGSFRPYVVMGNDQQRDKFHSLVIEYDRDPVIIAIVRAQGLDKVSLDDLQKSLGERGTPLIAALDQAVDKGTRKRLHAFVVYLDKDLKDVVGDDDRRDAAAAKLAALGGIVEKEKSERLRRQKKLKEDATVSLSVPLSLESEAKLKSWKLNPNAATTLLFYKDHKIVEARAFRAPGTGQKDDELNAAEAIKSGLAKLLKK
jgi:hypothetical protein